ncbi:MAG: choloylglycine hydrolase [Lactobacillus sp.]|uniref:choloylglycine hydrolase n=1 Tax=Lactobacillus sp. TaxID=1591 RepID=UPI0023BD8BA1|nr:choloylglycine hydrolase [Lactobacillus sp.]MDE7049419.1 choloylglycine hydrolase [Lactobacillus sp.]
MCTSILYSPKDHYFGRNLDYEIAYGQKVVITPRNYEFKFTELPAQKSHYAMIGVSAVEDNTPLYCDAINEKGLGVAGLSFAGSGKYFPVAKDQKNIASFEFIAYLLATYETVDQVKEGLANANISNVSFSKEMPAAELHWIVGDKTGKSIVVETNEEGLHIYDNPVNAMTNAPLFPEQLTNLANYAGVIPGEPENNFLPGVELKLYSRSLGTHHLPGGMDSESRFVKVCFALNHAPKDNDEVKNVTNFFHILQSVEQAKGMDQVGPNSFEYTMYTSCMNLEKGILYFNCYDNSRISAVDMNKEDLDSSDLIVYDLFKNQDISFIN